MPEYDDNMRMSMFKVVSDHPDAPMLRCVFQINGVDYECGLWAKTRRDDTLVKDKNNNQVYGGKINVDKRQQERDQPSAEPNRDPIAEADIPF